MHHDKWPSIEESIQLGKGAQRRLMMIPQKFSEWCVDASGYHPTTRGGQEKLCLQTENEIKCHMFSNQKWDSKMRDLATASDRLEESMEKMRRLGSTMGELDNQLVSQIHKEEDDQFQNSVDSRFEHSWTPSGTEPSGPGLGWF
jgi:hypothetical protein